VKSLKCKRGQAGHFVANKRAIKFEACDCGRKFGQALDVFAEGSQSEGCEVRVTTSLIEEDTDVNSRMMIEGERKEAKLRKDRNLYRLAQTTNGETRECFRECFHPANVIMCDPH
jgi:hypothetical protein